MSIFSTAGSVGKALLAFFLAQGVGDPRLRRAAALGLALVVLFTPSACALPAPGPPAPAATGGSGAHAVVIVATATSREPRPTLPQSVLALLRNLASAADARAVVLDDSGVATALPLAALRPSGRAEHRDTARRRLVQANLEAVGRRVAALTATRDGSDPLGRLDAASRIARPGTHLVVVSAGLSTVDPMNLLSVGWNVDPVALARYLADRGALPDLRGLHVLFAGLGVVAGGQPALPPGLRNRLAGYWLAVCHRAGAASCAIVPVDTLAGPAPSTRHRVPVVPVAVVPSLRAEAPSPGSGGPARQGRATAIGDAGFDLDSARLTPDAVAGLGGIADAMRASGDRIWLTGHTDGAPGPTAGYNRALSLARAAAVRAVLVRLGVPTGRITVTGVGDLENPPAARGSATDPVTDAGLRCVVLQLSAGNARPARRGCAVGSAG